LKALSRIAGSWASNQRREAAAKAKGLRIGWSFRLLGWETQGLADEGAFLLGELEEHGFVARLGLEVSDAGAKKAERQSHLGVLGGGGLPSGEPLVETSVIERALG
jgi:hypothetical protein